MVVLAHRLAEEKEIALLWTFVIALSALVVTLLVGRWLERRHIHRLPHSGVGVLVGAVCAGVVRQISQLSKSDIDDDVLKDERFDYDFFMITLLPPIIFEAGFNMELPPALRNLGLTTFLAFAGTTFSTFVVGGMCYWAGQIGICYPMGLLASLVFGSLISATDPVSVLSVFKACGVPDDVFAIVFGESVLNDAVAIVLTRTLLAFDDTISDPSIAQVFKAVALFVFDFASSLLIGAVFGFATAATMRRLGMRKRRRSAKAKAAEAAAAAAAGADAGTASTTNGGVGTAAAAPNAADGAPAHVLSPAEAAERETETLLTIALCFAFPWASFYVSEALQMSGVVTLLFCGIVMARHVRPLMSDEADRVATTAFKCVALVAETFVFVYLGEAIFSFPILHSTVWRMVAVAMVACGCGRLHVFLGVRMANAYRARNAAGGFGGGGLRESAAISPRTSNGKGAARPPHRIWGSRRLVEEGAATPPPQLSLGVAWVLWWSGLRGGVAFALASAS